MKDWAFLLSTAVAASSLNLFGTGNTFLSYTQPNENAPKNTLTVALAVNNKFVMNLCGVYIQGPNGWTTFSHSNYRNFTTTVSGDGSCLVAVNATDSGGISGLWAATYLNDKLYTLSGISGSQWRMTSSAPASSRWYTDPDFDDSKWAVGRTDATCTHPSWDSHFNSVFKTAADRPLPIWAPSCQSSGNRKNAYFRLVIRPNSSFPPVTSTEPITTTTPTDILPSGAIVSPLYTTTICETIVDPTPDYTTYIHEDYESTTSEEAPVMSTSTLVQQTSSQVPVQTTSTVEPTSTTEVPVQTTSTVFATSSEAPVIQTTSSAVKTTSQTYVPVQITSTVIQQVTTSSVTQTPSETYVPVQITSTVTSEAPVVTSTTSVEPVYVVPTTTSETPVPSTSVIETTSEAPVSVSVVTPTSTTPVIVSTTTPSASATPIPSDQPSGNPNTAAYAAGGAAAAVVAAAAGVFFVKRSATARAQMSAVDSGNAVMNPIYEGMEGFDNPMYDNTSFVDGNLDDGFKEDKPNA